MSSQSSFFLAVFGTAVAIFLVAHWGTEYMEVIGLMALAGGLGTVVSMILAVSMFKETRTRDAVLAACFCAALPFVVEWLLKINDTQLNVHGFSILGFIIYALGSWLCAIGLLIATAVRAIRSSKRRQTI